jgi:hypothetical protein
MQMFALVIVLTLMMTVYHDFGNVVDASNASINSSGSAYTIPTM